MNNSVFDKTMENVSKREKINLVTKKTPLKNTILSVILIRIQQYGLLINYLGKNHQVNKPVYLSLTVRDLSKK